MNLLGTESAIGLYAYHQPPPQALLYAHYYSFVLEELTRMGVEPTYFGADGASYPEEYVKYGGQVHKKVVDSNFQDVDGLSFAANPPGSDAPAYDSFFQSEVSYHISGFTDSQGRVVDLSFVINESFLPFGSQEFEQVLKRLINLYPWDFGMGFSDAAARRPELHIGCLGHDKLTPEEEEADNIWYNVPPDTRVQMLRSIYPYNIVNERQLGREVENGVTLKQLIEELPIGTLELMPQEGLYLWKVLDESKRKSLRTQLKEHSLVIS